MTLVQRVDCRQHPEFDGHEQVVQCHDTQTGLRAIIAIHNTSRGAALGGCRMWPYASVNEAITDALRLSRGMTYKSALANLPLGGGKAVIMGDPRHDKTRHLLLAMGEFVDSLAGQYVTAEDSGTCVEDMHVLAKRTSRVAGVYADPSPSTAYSTFVGLSAAVYHRLGTDKLDGVRVAVQGVGNVGRRLAKLLREAGAELFVCDVYEENLARVQSELDVTVVGAADIYDLDVDVFSPCALGAVINDDTSHRISAPIIAGAANNQLANSAFGDALHAQNKLYVPDYVLNAGGIVDIAYQRSGASSADTRQHIEGIADTLTEIFRRSDAEGRPTYQIADELAEERFSRETEMEARESRVA
ncbi:MAG: Glu/Leu/Phe/Val dehydrogenase dimerization domain-containing protein [Pseudomonadales bacterium]|nr:Glu/Leu/Phe/Val dehydrogenase dimerization domain-containing protein [Kiritimatiellia bacterium]MDP6972221.1 Glu/Leu/Phe/Val dehydrogenase dimerization domain-containing protein [Pseudomonadales bacterium]